MNTPLLITVALFVGLLLSPPIPQARGAEGALKLAINVSPKHDTLEAGAAIDALITIKNTSSSNLLFIQSHPDWDFTLEVRLHGGLELPRTEYGQYVLTSRGKFPPSAQRIEMKPGEQRTYTVRVNRQYDMSMTGTYDLKVSYVPLAPGEWHVAEGTSKPVQVRVVAPDSAPPAVTRPATQPGK